MRTDLDDLQNEALSKGIISLAIIGEEEMKVIIIGAETTLTNMMINAVLNNNRFFRIVNNALKMAKEIKRNEEQGRV